MKSTGHKIEFTSTVVREYGLRPTEVVGEDAKSAMTIYTQDGTMNTDRGQIDWEYCLGTPEADVTTIGIWWDKTGLTDYDGVFELPAQAVQLIRLAGIRVSKEYEPDHFEPQEIEMIETPEAVVQSDSCPYKINIVNERLFAQFVHDCDAYDFARWACKFYTVNLEIRFEGRVIDTFTC